MVRNRILIICVLMIFLNISEGYSANIIKTHAISLTDTIKYGADFKHFEYVNPDAPKGGTFKRALNGTFDSFNMFAVKGVSASGLGYIYDNLLTSSADEAGTYYGLLAESIEYPDDYSWVIFDLRKNAYWHDGKPVTSDDVVFSFNEIVKVSPYYKNYYALIDKVEALNKYRVKFTFKKEQKSKEMPLIAGQLTIIPKHYWEKRDLSKSTLEVPLGSGPYKISDYTAGKSITLERVDNYWGKDIPVNKGMDNFDKIIFEYFRDQTVAFEAFKAGQFDLISEGSGKRWYRGYTGKYFDAGYIKKEEIPFNNGQGMRGIFMNTSKYPLNNINVRKALNYAYDYEWINKNLYFGNYKRCDSYFSNSPLSSGVVPSKEVQQIIKQVKPDADKEFLSSPFYFPKNQGDVSNRKNLIEAVKLLNKAGYKNVNGKMVDKNGRPLILEIGLTSKSLENELVVFQKALARIGVELKILFLDNSQYMEKVRNKDFMLIYTGMRQSESPGNEQRSMWGSYAAAEKGSRNYASVQDKAVDKLIDLIINADTRKELELYTQALDRVLLMGWYVIPSGFADKYRLAYWDKFEKPKITPHYSLSISSWWIDTEKEKKINSMVIK